MSHPDAPDMTARGHYTFGDNAVAATRLQRLADLFRPSLEAVVTEHLPARVGHVERWNHFFVERIVVGPFEETKP